MKRLLLIYLSIVAVLSEETDIEKFAASSNDFTASLYNELLVGNNDNIVVSPFSVEALLALTQSGAIGDTGVEIRKALNLPDTETEIDALLTSVLPTFHDQLYKLHTANKVYVKESLPINTDFQKLATDVYEAAFENVDFTNNGAAAEEINEWVEQETEGKIKNFIDAGQIDPDLTQIILVNALYFQGNWTYPFGSSQTQPATFFKSETETTQGNFMYQKSVELNYVESDELDAQILELPFHGQDAAVVLVLPRQKEGIAILEKLSATVLETPKFNPTHVELHIPKFRIESSIQLSSALERLGIQKAFRVSEADFSGIGGSPGQIYFGNVFQKTYIDFNEGGVEAAAATAIGGPTEVTPPARAVFLADHPFAFYIKVNGIVLFEGRVLEPMYPS